MVVVQKNVLVGGLCFLNFVWENLWKWRFDRWSEVRLGT
jgi:hypothetical protein